LSGEFGRGEVGVGLGEGERGVGPRSEYVQDGLAKNVVVLVRRVIIFDVFSR
jgi:hypothetical protein